MTKMKKYCQSQNITKYKVESEKYAKINFITETKKGIRDKTNTIFLFLNEQVNQDYDLYHFFNDLLKDQKLIHYHASGIQQV